jgi:hypothetical protein
MCCALHDMLHDVDGLSKAWKNGACSHWEMASGKFRNDEIPFAIRRLIDPNGTEDFRLRHYDASQFEYRRPPVKGTSDKEDDDDDANQKRNRNKNWHEEHDKANRNNRIQLGTAVNELNFFQFCSLLVENFNICFHEKNLQWPKRLA